MRKISDMCLLIAGFVLLEDFLSPENHSKYCGHGIFTNCALDCKCWCHSKSYQYKLIDQRIKVELGYN